MAEATRILGAAIGRPDLAYVQFPYDAFAAALVRAGLYAGMAWAFNDGIVKVVGGRTPASATPTTFESFAKELAAACGAAG